MNIYVTYLTTREELFEVELDDKDWEDYVKTLPDYPQFDVNEAYNHFMNMDYLELYCDSVEIETVVERVEFSE